VTKRNVKGSCGGASAAKAEEGMAAETLVAPSRVRNCLRLVEFTAP
jgi:hypothetical protein